MLPYSWCVDAWHVAGQPRQHELLPARFAPALGRICGWGTLALSSHELLALFSPASLVLRWAASSVDTLEVKKIHSVLFHPVGGLARQGRPSWARHGSQRNHDQSICHFAWGAAAVARSSAPPSVDAPMATQRCLDAIAATRRASGRDDAAPLDLAAPATDLRAVRYVGDRPRHGRAAWHMTSAAREPMLRPDAVLSAAAPPARVDVSRPLDPLRCSDLSYHVMLFLCFARFIRLLLFFRRPVPLALNPPATVFGCQKSVLTSVL